MWNPVKHITDQFKKPSIEDFPNVWEPLEGSRRLSSIAGGDVEKLMGKPGNSAASSPPASDDDTEKGKAFGTTDSAGEGTTLQKIQEALDEEASAFGAYSSYDRKSKIINMAISDIGFGRYQYAMFVLCGFGWFADNFWLQGVAVTLPQLQNEFGLEDTTVRFTTLSLFLGLTIGASFWGIAADIIGRRLAFNVTLFLAAIFGMAAGGPGTWIGVCSLYACVGLGVGGNLPVDGALFLEFLPMANGQLLTGLSVWWPVGSLVASLIAWGFIVAYSCDPMAEVCTRANNPGWRYTIITLGAITFLQWAARFLLFHLYESPKFLLAKGRQEEAVAVVYAVAKKNGKKTWLTSELLDELGGKRDSNPEKQKMSNVEIVKHSLSKFSFERFKPLFAERKIGISTGLLWFIWTTIGMGYPLFNAFLPQYIGRNATINETYRNYAISNVVGVPGSLIAIYTVNLKYVGRKGTMAVATVLTGVFVCLFTISKDPNFQLGMTCMEAFWQNVMYGVLYAYTPEIFPATIRGTGTGVSSTFNRIAGLCAPLVGIYAGTANPTAPIYASAALFFAAFLAMLCLPIETRGRQSL